MVSFWSSKMERRYAILAASFSIAFMAYAVRYAYSMMLPEMEIELGLNNFQAGLIYSTFLGTYTIFSLIVGFLIDVRDLRRVIISFLPLFALGTALMGYASSLWQASLFFGIAGIGAAIGWTPIVVWVQRAFPSRRGAALIVVQLGVNLGFAILGILLPTLLLQFGWRGVWVLLGVVAALWLLPVTFVAKGASAPENGRSSSEYFKGFGSAVRSGKFWAGGISYLLAAYAIMTPMTFSAVYARALGAGVAGEGAVFSMIGFVGLIGAVAIPALSDVIGRKWALGLNNTIMMLGLLGSAVAGSYHMLILWTIPVAISYGGVWVLYAALVRDLFHSKVAGGIMGAWTLLGGVGLLLSPVIGGFLVDVLSYEAAYVASAILSLVSILLVLGIRHI